MSHSIKANQIKLLILLLAAFMASSSALSQTETWPAVSPEELALKESKVEKDADAEAIFWNVSVKDEGNKASLLHHLRIKIFTEKGRNSNAKVEIPFGKISKLYSNIKIEDIAARTITNDGRIIELNPKDIYEQDKVLADGVKLRAKSFVLPGIDIGCIIEYRWKEVREGGLPLYYRMDMARDIPVQIVRYRLNSTSLFPMKIHTFNGDGKIAPFEKQKDGAYTTSISDVPAYRQEPDMPSPYAVRPWLLIYFSLRPTQNNPQDYWKDYGKRIYESHRLASKPSGSVKKAAAEAVGDETDPVKKLERIFNYCRSKVKNIYDDVNGFTSEQLKSIKENEDAGDVLKRGTGTWHDIDMLFMAMATAAGFDARVGKLPQRADQEFNANFLDPYFMTLENIAVKVGNEWMFFDPSDRYVPFGMLNWEQEGQPVLISDEKDPIWAKTRYSSPQNSVDKRFGKFKLLADGSLEGEVRFEFSGHWAAFYKERNDDRTIQEQEDNLKQKIKTEISDSATVTGFSVENIADPDKPFFYKFNLKVPGYATKTGKRLFFQPNVFKRNSKPLFTSSDRRYDIFINYSWSESDNIEIELPEGFILESPDVPAPIKDAQGISSEEINILVSKTGKIILYKRNFYFGDHGYLNFPPTSYSGLKGLFDAFHQAETHIVTLKQQ